VLIFSKLLLPTKWISSCLHSMKKCKASCDCTRVRAVFAAAYPFEDGLLTADEVAHLDLTADLVVLSACESGLGRVGGDGIIGLSRSFILAGADSVVVSL
jgi:CHAT domain-containing protein